MSEFAMQSLPNGRYAVTLDGKDVADRLTGVTIETNAGSPSHITLTLPPSAIRVLLDATVDIDEKARELLIDLGWTPPVVEDEPSERSR